MNSSTKTKKSGKYFNCKECGKEFYVLPYRLASTTGFCSRNCRKTHGLETRECVVCGKSMTKARWLFNAKVEDTCCSNSCGMKLTTQRNPKKKKYEKIMVSGYVAETGARDHPLANKNGVLLEHRKVLYEKIGEGPHECHWCGEELEWGGVEGICADHLDEDKMNNDPENLVPSCHLCNWRR